MFMGHYLGKCFENKTRQKWDIHFEAGSTREGQHGLLDSFVKQYTFVTVQLLGIHIFCPNSSLDSHTSSSFSINILNANFYLSAVMFLRLV